MSQKDKNIGKFIKKPSPAAKQVAFEVGGIVRVYTCRIPDDRKAVL
jgi:hypothetical protein